MKPFSQQDLIRNQVRIASCLLNIRSGNLLLTTSAVSILGILESGSERSLQAEGIRCDRIGILYCQERDSADTGSEESGHKSQKKPVIKSLGQKDTTTQDQKESGILKTSLFNQV